ncbi:FAD-binding oxidoreductase [Corynebacterium sp. LK28]|uniref:FAD-binding oxidoreductase n=1 Tax=Corynebacterium sp. LK28 TaxID=2044579 RepID=UPI0016525A0A|nr:flavohemoprotein [Corynebacterium sp. LK28]
MARHSSSEEYTFAELLALIEEHRHDLVELTRAKLHDMHLTPTVVHFPHPAGAEYSNPSPSFSETMELDKAYLDRTIRFILRGITHCGEFAPAQGEFLVATGKDSRKFGVAAEHYAALESALVEAVGEHIGVTKKLSDTINLGCSLLAYGAIEDEEAAVPATSAAQVLEVLHPCDAIAVIRVQMDPPLPYWSGQHVEVRTPHTPQMWRALSPAIPYNEDGLVEFHVRAIGPFSQGIVENTQVGEQWVVANPYGELQISGNKPVVMVAGSTGLAPVRAILLELVQSGERPPMVQLFFGAQNPEELYEWKGLVGFEDAFDWLDLYLVVEDNAPTPEGFDAYTARGLVGDVAAARGAWRDAEVLITGGPKMKQHTVEAFLRAGADRDQLRFDVPHS